VIALKGFHVHSQGISLTQARAQLYFAVGKIVVLDESADEANHDDGRQGRDSRCRNRLRQAGLAQGKSSDE
jgi:hypothetical protein